jgi:hypothetical protein
VKGHYLSHRGKFVAYYQDSTDKQGKSGLGLEAVLQFLNGGPWSLVGEFTEIESGKRNKRPELEKALTICKRQKAKLVIRSSTGCLAIWLSSPRLWTQAWSKISKIKLSISMIAVTLNEQFIDLAVC